MMWLVRSLLRVGGGGRRGVEWRVEGFWKEGFSWHLGMGVV